MTCSSCSVSDHHSSSGDAETVCTDCNHSTIFVVSSMFSADDGVGLEMDAGSSSSQEALGTNGKSETRDPSLDSTDDEAIDISETGQENDPSDGIDNFSYTF